MTTNIAGGTKSHDYIYPSNDEVDAFNDLFMAEAERDHDAAEGLMAFVRRLNPRLLTNDGDLDLEKLTAGELRQMHRFLEDHAAGKRPRE